MSKMKLEEFINRANKIHNFKYDYSKFNYTGSNNKGIIICPLHGEFLQTSSNHLRGRGCFKCFCGSIEKFVNKANKIHSFKYDYSKFVYVKSHIKGIIICPIHGEFEQTPADHNSGHGCPYCKAQETSRRRFLGINAFIIRSKKIHGEKYDYSKFIYFGNNIKGIIICPIHGEFLQSPNNHMHGNGCPICAGTKRFTLEEFINKANKIHNNKYDYSKFEYTNCKTKGIIVCLEHLDFKQTPNDHLNGVGCPICGGKTKLTKDQFVYRANIIHNNKYNYNNANYINAHTYIIIMCPIHGEFRQKPYSHLAGQGCKKCSIIYSKKSEKWIDSFNNKNIIKSFSTIIDNKRFEFDGFDETTNTIYEFYGDLFHGNPEIYKQGDRIFFGKTFKELYEKTLEREKFLKKFGFNIITIWEKDFDEK